MCPVYALERTTEVAQGSFWTWFRMQESPHPIASLLRPAHVRERMVAAMSSLDWVVAPLVEWWTCCSRSCTVTWIQEGGDGSLLDNPRSARVLQCS